MNTIVISVDEAARNLRAVIRRLRECGGRAVLTGANGSLAEITPVMPSDTESAVDASPAGAANSDGTSGKRTGPRVVYCELTGLPVVTARPGSRKITSEEIYEELRGSFP